jgi:hypothetical protein
LRTDDNNNIGEENACILRAAEGERCGAIESAFCDAGLKCVLGTCTK